MKKTLGLFFDSVNHHKSQFSLLTQIYFLPTVLTSVISTMMVLLLVFSSSAQAGSVSFLNQFVAIVLAFFILAINTIAVVALAQAVKNPSETTLLSALKIGLAHLPHALITIVLSVIAAVMISLGLVLLLVIIFLIPSIFLQPGNAAFAFMGFIVSLLPILIFTPVYMFSLFALISEPGRPAKTFMTALTVIRKNIFEVVKKTVSFFLFSFVLLLIPALLIPHGSFVFDIVSFLVGFVLVPFSIIYFYRFHSDISLA